MALFNLSTPKGRFDFSTNKTLEFAFQQAVIEVSAESIDTPGDGTSFPFFGKLAYDKIKSYTLSVFRSGVNIDRQTLAAFITTLPQVTVDEANITTTLYDDLVAAVKDWIVLRQDVSSSDKVTNA